MVVEERIASRFVVTGNFFEETTERINDKMPESFEFRGKHDDTVDVAVHFIRNSNGECIATFVVKKKHYVGEE